MLALVGIGLWLLARANGGAPLAPLAPRSVPNPDGTLPGRLIVVFQPGADLTGAAAVATQVGARVTTTYGPGAESGWIAYMGRGGTQVAPSSAPVVQLWLVPVGTEARVIGLLRQRPEVATVDQDAVVRDFNPTPI
jgi:hypothetical protein